MKPCGNLKELLPLFQTRALLERNIFGILVVIALQSGVGPTPLSSNQVSTPAHPTSAFRLPPPRPRQHAAIWQIWIIGLIMGAIAGTALRHEIAGQTATLRVDALITNGSIFRIYYNNDWEKPQDLPAVPNRWNQYVFTVPARLTALRFDLPDVGAHTFVRFISVTSGTRVSTIPVAQLSGWIGAHLNSSLQPDGTVLLTSDGPGGYLMSSEDIQAASSRPILQHLHLDAQTLFWFSFSALLLLFVVRARHYVVSALVIVGSILIALFVGRFAAIETLHIHGRLPAVSSAIGAAAYMGLSLSNELRSVNFGIAAAAIVAAMICFLWLRKESGLRAPFRPESNKVRIAFFFSIVLVCGVFALPLASQYLAGAAINPHPTDFDSQNLLTWEFLRFHGKLPFRDYWFPYGGFYDRLAPLYPDLFFEFLNELLLIAVFVWFGLKILHNRLSMMVGCCLLFFFFQSAHLFWPGASPRYFLSFALVLITAVAVQEASLSYFAFLGAFFAYVIWQEASQAIFAAPASALLIGVGILMAPAKQGRLRLLKSLGVGMAAGAFGFALYIAGLYKNAQLPEWWTFISKVNDSAAYGAVLAPISDWVSLRSGLSSALLLLIAFLVVAGLVHIIWPAVRRDIYSFLPLSLGILSWMMLQKQIIRPGMETQIIAIPLFGVVLLIFQRIEGRSPRAVAAWLSFSAGFLFFCFILDSGTWNAGVMPQLDRVEETPSDVKAMLFSPQRWTVADQAYFAPQLFQFAGFAPGLMNGAQVRDHLRTLVPVAANDTVYNLGNEPLTYILLQKSVPFYTNIYNESPIYAQRKTIEWLQQYEPKYVFWNSSSDVFDGVPDQIRIPLVYTYVLQHYRFAAADAKYQVLQRMGPGERPDFVYWTKTLGTTFDLGFVTAASDLRDSEQGATRVEVLDLQIAAPREGAQASVPIQFGDNTITVSLKEVAGKRTYIARLDRIPILEAAHSTGLELHLGTPSAGATAFLRTLSVPADDLY